jgi:hypothetical protein
MRNTFQRLTIAASVVLGLTLLSGQARAVTYDISGTNYNYEGGPSYTLTGTIVGDATLSTITSINLVDSVAPTSPITTIDSYTSPLLLAANTVEANNLPLLISLSFSGGPTLAQAGQLIQTTLAGPGFCGNDPACQAIAAYQNSFVVTATAEVSATPLPAALPLFAGGLSALGLLGWRRKRKAAALAA